MKTFLNLSIAVINKLHITEICKRRTGIYTIYLNPTNAAGFWLFGNGFVSTKYNTIEICKKKNENDYKQITIWIDSRDDN